MSSNHYLGDFLNLVVTMAARSLKFDACSILLSDPAKGMLVLKASSTGTPEDVRSAAADIEKCLAHKVLEENGTILVADSEVGCGELDCSLLDSGPLRSYVAYPLRSGDRVIGAFCGYFLKPHVYTDEEVGMIAAIAGQAALAIENSQLIVKGAIVQEMHHRVKNNLQTIASLLRLQMRHSDSTTVVRALQESIGRILSIAAVHEILAGEDMGVVSMHEVVSALLKELHQMAFSPERKLSTALYGKDILLPARQATTAALILNELIQNAIEHGIGERESGRIEVTFKEQHQRVKFMVANDGAPLPDDFDVATADGLGLQIVKTLVRGELQGAFSISCDAMTVATVEFPRPDLKTNPL